MKFEELQISPEILRAIQDMGFEEATPIQSQSLDIIKAGRDMLGQSQTGTGKTAAFGIPTLELMDPDNRQLQALVLCPTRELAMQVSEELRKLLKYKSDVRVLPVYGGQPIDRQIMALRKGVQIVIGTPGRVMDHMKRRTIKLDNLKMLVLDEADEMLDMGFREDIEEILEQTPEERQIVLFSATMRKEIMDLTNRYLVEPGIVKVAAKELTVPLIDQVYFELRDHNKMEGATRLIDMHNPELCLIFCNTKKRVDEVVESLQGRGYFAEGLHGDLKQTQRDAVMKKFRNRTLEILVATDVAARGIDVDNVEMVINYDLPQDEEQYVHRIGRTGRAGRHGKAFTFVVGREIYKLRDIMRFTKATILREKLPTLSDIEDIKAKHFVDKITKTIEEENLTKYIHMAESMTNDEDIAMIDIAAALLKMSLKDDHEGYEDINERPFQERHNNRGQDSRGGRDSGRSSRDSYGRNGGGSRGTNANQERLFINVGKNHRVKPGDIVGAIANEANISGRSIGGIDIFDDFTFVDVPKEHASNVIERLKNIKFKGVKLNIERAKKGRR